MWVTRLSDEMNALFGRVAFADTGQLRDFHGVYVCVTALHKSRLYRRQRSFMVDPSSRFLSVEVKPDRNSRYCKLIDMGAYHLTFMMLTFS